MWVFLPWSSGRRVRVFHYDLAMTHKRICQRRDLLCLFRRPYSLFAIAAALSFDCIHYGFSESVTSGMHIPVIAMLSVYHCFFPVFFLLRLVRRCCSIADSGCVFPFSAIIFLRLRARYRRPDVVSSIFPPSRGSAVPLIWGWSC